MNDRYMIIMAVITGLAVLFCLFMFIRVIIPLRKIKKTATKISDGEFDVLSETVDSKAYGMFSESFNTLYDELVRSRKREIALMDKEKEIFATVGRELSDPITGIKLTAELLRTKLITDKGSEADGYIVEKLEKIYDKADETGIRLNSILSTALDDLGEYIVNCSDIESRALEDMIRKYDYRHVVSMTNIPHVLIHIDAGRMSRVIGNIIENSYKYANTPIDISFLLTDDFLQMKIADHGPGVPQDEIRLITNRFYRGRDWVDSVEEGSGQGLYLAKTFMEKMDGNLYVDNGADGLCATLLIKLS